MICIMKYRSFILMAFVVTCSSLKAQNQDRILFKFDTREAAQSWQAVNDGVMGGRFKINDDKKMEFYGTLSLENNGGFASVRTRGANLELAKDDVIVARVRGDGREYGDELWLSLVKRIDGEQMISMLKIKHKPSDTSNN